jgi:signal transduction histidine kinase
MNPPDKIGHDALRLRAAAESQIDDVPLRGKDPAHPDAELLHELQVHQVELEMQNEALRQKQTELEAMRDRYIDLHEFSPVGYLTLSADGMIDEINFTATTLLGVERKNLMRRQFTSLVITEDQSRWTQLLVSVLQSDGKGSMEVSLQRGAGMVFQAQLDCTSHTSAMHSGAFHAVDSAARTGIRGDGYGKQEVRIALSDITVRKQAEAELSRYRHHLEEQVAERTLTVRSMATEIMTAEARERRILAAELHDNLGQNLALIKLKLASLAGPVEGAARVDHLQDMKTITDLLDQANASVRSLSTQLSPLVLSKFGLVAALESLTEDFLRVWGLRVSVHLCDEVTLDNTTAAALFRIVRELLLNILKHARVSEATLIMTRDADSGMLEISVVDEGIGFDVEKTLAARTNSGYGLGSIRERIEFLGGKMLIDSQMGNGTIVSLTLMPEPVGHQ